MRSSEKFVLSKSRGLSSKFPSTYFFRVQENFTKYSLAIPLPNNQAGTIVDAFVKKFICIFESQKGVLMVQGRDFLSNLLKRLAKRFRTKQFRTTAFHPQSNESLEWSNHVLDEYLKQFVAKNSGWDDWLELAMFSYNTSVHEATQYTSYELVLGKLAHEPSSEPLSQNEKLQTYDDYLINFVTQLHEMRTQARENLIKAKEKSRMYHDRKINPLEIKIGDNVFLLKGGKIKKLDNQYTEPHEVLDVLGKGNVKINIKGKPTVVHVNRIKRSHINIQNWLTEFEFKLKII